MLAERVFAFEAFARQRLADDDFVRALQPLIIGEGAAGDEGYLHGLEVAGVGKDCGCIQYLPFRQEAGARGRCRRRPGGVALSGEQGCGCGRLYAWNLADLLEQIIVEGSDLRASFILSVD